MAETFTILHIEDMPNNRDLVRRILQSKGYTVVEAENGLEGIQKAIETEPDLILTDINLPDMDGFSVVTRLRNHKPLANTPIIAITARNVADDVERAKAIGCDSYISKPFSVAQLIEEVASHIGKPRATAAPQTRQEAFLREHSANLVEELERKFNELSKTHAELNDAYERLQRLDEAKSAFIHIAAHELRTPLTTVTAYTDMLKTQLPTDENPFLLEMIEGLKAGVKRMNDITQDMVSIARVETADENLSYDAISVSEFLTPTLKDINKRAEERQLTLKVQIPDSLPDILGDADQLQQAFSRLLGNAIKYTPDFGSINVHANLHFDENQKGQQSQFVEISIADTGIGINKDEQSLIFEKFYTAEDTTLHSSSDTKFMGGGPGLGLTIAKGIVEAHNGRIWVESDGYDPKNNPGSTFYVLLPIAKDN